MMQSSVKSLIVEVIELGRSLIYIGNRSGPRILPWGTPDVTRVSYGTELLMTTD